MRIWFRATYIHLPSNLRSEFRTPKRNNHMKVNAIVKALTPQLPPWSQGFRYLMQIKADVAKDRE